MYSVEFTSFVCLIQYFEFKLYCISWNYYYYYFLPCYFFAPTSAGDRSLVCELQSILADLINLSTIPQISGSSFHLPHHLGSFPNTAVSNSITVVVMFFHFLFSAKVQVFQNILALFTFQSGVRQNGGIQYYYYLSSSCWRRKKIISRSVNGRLTTVLHLQLFE